MRRVQSTSVAAASRLPIAAAQLRTKFWFSENAMKLQELQAKNSFASDLWVEQSEAKFLKLDVRPNTLPFAVRLPHQLELFNLDDVTIPDDVLKALPPVNEHTSFSTQKPYGQQLRFELENRATMKGYRSKWWITPQSVRNLKFTAAGRGVQSALILIESNETVFNGSQLVDPTALNRLPISGATKKLFRAGGIMNPAFLDDIKAKTYETGVYFSANHLRALDLNADPSQEPLLITFGDRQERGPYLLYNLSQVEGWESLAVAQATQHSFFEGGYLVKSEAILSKLQEVENQFPTKYWLSDRDVKSKGLKLKEGQTGVDASSGLRKMTDSIGMYNIDQLIDKKAGKAAFGKLVR